MIYTRFECSLSQARIALTHPATTRTDDGFSYKFSVEVKKVMKVGQEKWYLMRGSGKVKL
jgi:hypothetical protein